MAIQSVTLDALPARVRELTEDERALATAIAGAATDGQWATDGEIHVDSTAKVDGKNVTTTGRSKAQAIVSAHKRLLDRAKVTPEGMVPKTAVRANGNGWSWYLTFTTAPAEPRKRNRKPKTS